MNYERLFSSVEARVVRAGVVGVGEFGVSLAARDRHLKLLNVSALADVHITRAIERLRAAGFARDELVICETVSQALVALEAGKRVLTPDPALLVALPLDVLVDATGDPETAARTAEQGILRGMHVVMASKEADSVVGPMLYLKAREAGLVYTPVDGDQPSLLIKLVSWARKLGLEVVAAGKASEHDFVYDAQNDTVMSQRRSLCLPQFRELWAPAPAQSAGIVKRSALLASLPQKSVPDFCEIGIVANATGLMPDRQDMHAPIARTVELPDLFCKQEEGGLFARAGALDIFNCLRRSDEASFAGGVFVVVDIQNDATFAVLQGKGIPASRRGSRLLLYNPTHLLGIEAPISILSAALLGCSSVTSDFRPRCDLVGRALRDIPAGTTFAIAHAHTHAIADLEPLLVDAGPVRFGRPLPYYLAIGRRLGRELRAGECVTPEALEPAQASTLWRLRKEQDSTFFPVH